MKISVNDHEVTIAPGLHSRQVRALKLFGVVAIIYLVSVLSLGVLL